MQPLDRPHDENGAPRTPDAAGRDVAEPLVPERPGVVAHHQQVRVLARGDELLDRVAEADARFDLDRTRHDAVADGSREPGADGRPVRTAARTDGDRDEDPGRCDRDPLGSAEDGLRRRPDGHGGDDPAAVADEADPGRAHVGILPGSSATLEWRRSPRRRRTFARRRRRLRRVGWRGTEEDA
ncbi:hypothetical protein GCM10009869_29740 [Amnibacterium kyonggiense]